MYVHTSTATWSFHTTQQQVSVGGYRFISVQDNKGITAIYTTDRTLVWNRGMPLEGAFRTWCAFEKEREAEEAARRGECSLHGTPKPPKRAPWS